MNKGYHPESRDTPKYPSCPESLVTVNPNKTLTRTKGLDSQKRLAPGTKHQEAPSGCPSASSWPPKGRPHTQRHPSRPHPSRPHPSRPTPQPPHTPQLPQPSFVTEPFTHLILKRISEPHASRNAGLLLGIGARRQPKRPTGRVRQQNPKQHAGSNTIR